MSIHTEEKQITAIINSICAYMLQMVSAKGVQAAEFRREVGLIKDYGLEYLADNTFGTNLFDCFALARTLPITADLVAVVRQQITALNPTTPIATLIYDTAIQFCLTTECSFIMQTTFKSRNDVQNMMTRMTNAFNVARDNAAERMDSATYQNLTYLAGSIVQYLASNLLTLPQIVRFTYNVSWPALTLANMIYQDTSREEELIVENKVVHPLFCPRSIIGLSS
jgi:prophage DNA circulation protein